MRKINSAIDGLRPSGSLLQQAFASLTEGIGNFGREVLNVAETALGVMLRDAIEFIIGKLGELIKAIFETGSEFQLLKIRLTGLNLNDFADGTRSFAEAMSMASQKTKEELDWLQTLGSATPFDPAQIANTYTQARAFGFAADEAQRLTKDIIDYTAGMGLSNETLFLVIQNLGQMVQRGKITGTEIRDLARGSFLPLADVLERIAKNMGMTVKELTKQISTPEGIPAAEFVKAFEAMVEEEPRFVGAAGRMSRALLPASQNVKELFTSVFGLNVATPVFDVLGEKVASLVDQFAFFNEQGELVKTQKWNDLVNAASALGDAISMVVKSIVELIPGAETLTDALIQGIQNLTIWIMTHQRDILNFFIGIGKAITEGVIPFIRDQLIPFFQRIVTWVVENWPLIEGFFKNLGMIATTVLGNLFGGAFKEGDFLGGILDAIKYFMAFVIVNKDKIAEWATILIKVFIAVEVLITVFNIIIGVIGAVVGAILGFIGFLVSLVVTVLAVVAGVSFLAENFLVLVAIFGAVIVGIGSIISAIMTFLTIKTISDFIVNEFAPAISNSIGGMVAQISIYLDLFQARWATAWISIQSGFLTAQNNFNNGIANLGQLFTIFPYVIQPMVNGFKTALEIMSGRWDFLIIDIRQKITQFDWGAVGRAITSGVAQGISSGVGSIITAAVAAAQAAYSAAMTFLGAHSPSKLFMGLGLSTMQGMAEGINKFSGLAAGAMSQAMQQVAAPAITMPGMVQNVIAQGAGGVTNNSDTRTYNLTVHSSAQTEPIIQDFNMLSSLSGV